MKELETCSNLCCTHLLGVVSVDLAGQDERRVQVDVVRHDHSTVMFPATQADASAVVSQLARHHLAQAALLVFQHSCSNNPFSRPLYSPDEAHGTLDRIAVDLWRKRAETTTTDGRFTVSMAPCLHGKAEGLPHDKVGQLGPHHGDEALGDVDRGRRALAEVHEEADRHRRHLQAKARVSTDQ